MTVPVSPPPVPQPPRPHWASRPIRIPGSRWAGALVWLVLGVWLIWLGIGENRQHWLLKQRGQRTVGMLQKVTRTQHNVYFIPVSSIYTFDVAFRDLSGMPRNLHCVVNGALLDKHMVARTTYQHDVMEVVFLPDDPKVAGLPEMLGISLGHLCLGA